MKRRLRAGDWIRIPLGFLLVYLSVAAVWKGWTSFDGSGISLFVLLLSTLVGLFFLAIGLVMAFGWTWAKRR